MFGSDKKNLIGKLSCRVCKAEHASRTHKLSQNVDVYRNWLDECERVNQRIAKQKALREAAKREEEEEHLAAHHSNNNAADDAAADARPSAEARADESSHEPAFEEESKE